STPAGTPSLAPSLLVDRSHRLPPGVNHSADGTGESAESTPRRSVSTQANEARMPGCAHRAFRPASRSRRYRSPLLPSLRAAQLQYTRSFVDAGEEFHSRPPTRRVGRDVTAAG